MVRKTASQKRLVFVSHVHEDARLAAEIRRWVDEALLGAVEFFISSDDASLPPGSDWPTMLKKSLADASIALLIISPASIERRWIYFEAGAAYLRGIPVVPICVNGVTLASLQPPLMFFQALELPNQESERRLVRLIAEHTGLRTPKSLERLVLPEIRYETSVQKSEEEAVPKSQLDIPLSKREARSLVNGAPPYLAQKLDQLTLLLDMWNADGSISDLAGLRARANRCLQVSGFVDKETGVQISNLINREITPEMVIDSIGKEKYDKYPSTRKYEEVRISTKPIKQFLAEKGISEQVIKQEIEETPPQILCPYLVLLYYELDSDGNSLALQSFVEDQFLELGYKAPLKALASQLRDESIIYMRFDKMLSVIRGLIDDEKEFSQWYRRLRGMSYQEEIERQRTEEQQRMQERKIEIELEQMRRGMLSEASEQEERNGE